MAYWDQVYKFKSKIIQQGEISTLDLNGIYEQYDIATAHSTAVETIKILAGLTTGHALYFVRKGDERIRLDSPFKIAYLFFMYYDLDVYHDRELSNSFPKRTEEEDRKWNKLKRIKEKKSSPTIRLLRRTLDMLSSYYKKLEDKQLRQLK